MKKIFFLIYLTFLSFTFAQSIKGSIPEYKGKKINLVGYIGFSETMLGETTLDPSGNFYIQYDKAYRGAAILQILEGNSVIILLNNENFELVWNDPRTFDSLKISSSEENNNFIAGIQHFQNSDNKINALSFLLPLYENEPEKKQWLKNEMNFQQSSFDHYLNKLPKESYAGFYLNLRQIIAKIGKFNSQSIYTYDEIQKEVTNLDFNNEDLWHSGLYKTLLDNYFLVTENFGNPEIITENTNTSVDKIMESLKTNPDKQLEVATYLIKLLEMKSLFQPAEHLAMKIIKEHPDHSDQKRMSVFEQYRTMAVGNTAPDIDLGENKKLSEIKKPYKLVVFGASWCPYCVEDLPHLKSAYPSLKEKYDLEIIYISLDYQKPDYENFLRDADFISLYGGNGWESKAAKDYFIFSTPSMIILDQHNKILTKLKTVPHLEAWMQEFGIQKL